jgi:hypothetical protein
MLDCSEWKAAAAFDSDLRLRATVMSTMLPEEMSGGRRMEGNSICDSVSKVRSAGPIAHCREQLWGPGNIRGACLQ